MIRDENSLTIIRLSLFDFLPLNVLVITQYFTTGLRIAVPVPIQSVSIHLTNQNMENRLSWKHRSLRLKWYGQQFPYGGPQLSHQNQMFTANYKSLTSNSNRSQQIQIAHSKFKSLTANYKSLTANSNHSQRITNHSQQITNRSQQIQIAHSKLKSFIAN